MDRFFRFTLRFGALALLGVGVWLVVLSVQTDDEGPPMYANQPDANQQVPADTAINAEEEVRLERFLHTMEVKDGRKTTLEGPVARINQTRRITTIQEPLVTSWLINEDGTEVRDVQLTAQEAVWLEEENLVTLKGNVVATGDDFAIRTESVSFNTAERTLATLSRVTIEVSRADAQGRRANMMETTSRGMKADLLLSRLVLHEDVTSTVYAAAADVFADDSTAAGTAGGDLVIRSDGEAVYQHGAMSMTYEDTVRAESGAKDLKCDRLTIQFEQASAPAPAEPPAADGGEAPADETPRMSVSQVTATGHVLLTATLADTNLVARGDELAWQNLAQIITLTGKPAQVDTDEFHAEGEKVKLVRLTAGYRVDGKGALVWKAVEDEAAPAAEAAVWQPVPLKLDKTEPTRVDWADSMSYDTATHTAVFAGEVAITQPGLRVDCRSLTLRFADVAEPGADERSLQPVGIIADGAVKVVADPRQIACERLEWDGTRNVITMKAAEGADLTITQGRMTIASQSIVVDNAKKQFIAPGPGRLNAAGKPDADGKPTEDALVVTWQGQAVLNQGEERYAEFKGNVRARSAPHRLEGETVRVDLDEEMSPTTIHTSGDAVIDVTTPAKATGAEAPEDAPPIPGAGVDRWELTGPTFTIDVAGSEIKSDKPGLLTMFYRQVPKGSLMWKKSVSLDMNNNKAVFEGQVIVTTAEGIVQGDKLEMRFGLDAQEERREIKQIGVEGNASFKSAGENALSLKAASALAVFATGNELSQFIAYDNVELKDRERTLKSGTLKMTFGPVQDEGGNRKTAVVHAQAEKDVQIDYENEPIRAAGESVEWDRKADTYTLTGQPAWIERGGLKTQGKKLTYYGPTGETP